MAMFHELTAHMTSFPDDNGCRSDLYEIYILISVWRIRCCRSCCEAQSCAGENSPKAAVGQCTSLSLTLPHWCYHIRTYCSQHATLIRWSLPMRATANTADPMNLFSPEQWRWHLHMWIGSKPRLLRGVRYSLSFWVVKKSYFVPNIPSTPSKP